MLFIINFLLPVVFSRLLQIKHINEFESATSPDATPAPTPTPIPAKKKGLSAAMLIVIIVSVIVVGSVLITLLVFWIIKKAKSYGHDLEENLMGTSNSFHQQS